MTAVLAWIICIGILAGFLLIVDKAIQLIEETSPERVKRKPLTMDDDLEYWNDHSD